MKTLISTITLALALGACADDSGNGNMFGTGADAGDEGGNASAGTSASSGGDGTGSAGDGGTEGGDDDGGVKYDVDEGESATGGDGKMGCEKIDFLFIVDNSGSMSPHQQNLANNFGPFIDTIAQEVQGTDHHIMVVDTDACPAMSGGCAPTSCEDTLGAGQVRSCAVPQAQRFMTSAMPIADIKSAFQCAALVGDQGSAEELPMTAMTQVLGVENEASGCNPGFVRDDAVLVVTFITDDHTGWFGTDDVSTVGSPQEWFDTVVAKKGKVDNVVMLGLVALLADQSCIGFGPKEADRFVDFIGRFNDHGVIGSVCDSDYNSFFQDAVALIDTTCDEFVPEG